MKFLKNFLDYSQMPMFEAVRSIDSSNMGLLLHHDGSQESAQKMQRYADELMEKSSSPEAISKGKQLVTSGESALKYLQDAWEARKSAGVDKGELRRVGEWYIGKGAWRINSNKAIKLGMKPAWMEWSDPLQEEILQNFFPELVSGGSDYAKQGTKLEKPEMMDLPQGGSSQGMEELLGEPELASFESRKFKYVKSIFEATMDASGAVAPPSSGKSEVEVYTPDELIRQLVRIYNDDGGRYMPMIWGAPGIGKTAIVRSVAQLIANQKGLKQGLPVMVVTLANFTPTDLGGVPLLFQTGSVEKAKIYQDKPGEELDLGDLSGTDKVILPASMRGKISQEQTIPGWLPGEADAEEGILFFDEINRADPMMLGASLTLLLDRQTASGRYTMPWGWRVMAAGNRRSDGPVTELEAAVGSRFTGGHFHLVPTIQNWIEQVARSPKNGIMRQGSQGAPLMIDGSEQYFIPQEFLSYLRTIDGTPAKVEYFDRKGEPIKTDFKAFYFLDKSKAEAAEEGVFFGYPNPRSWTVAWAQISSQILMDPKYLNQVPDATEPNMKVSGAFKYALMDEDGRYDIGTTLGRIIGRSAAQEFLSWVKIIAKYTDDNGTLYEKIENIFKDPSLPRPLSDIPPVKETSELQAILSLITSYIQDSDDTLKVQGTLYWCKWIQELWETKKVKDVGLLATAVANTAEVAPNFAKSVGQLYKISEDFKAGRTTEDKARKINLIMKPFSETFQEQLRAFGSL
jgi:MoxR-like ATPase